MELDEITKALGRMSDWQSVHEVQDNTRHEENLGRFDVVGSALHEIKTNHLRHIEDDTTELTKSSIEVKADMWWIKKGLIAVFSGIGLLFITLLGTLLLK